MKSLNNNIYLKKISIGINLSFSKKEYENIINKYLPYLNSVYFSLPYGDEFHTRAKVIEEYKDENASEKLLSILKLFKSNGVKIEAVVNQYHIGLEKLKEALKQLDNFISIDSICCLDEYLDIIDKHYEGRMEIVRSINNTVIHNTDINKISKKYKVVVLGREYLRNIGIIENIKKQGFKTKLLLNNGCSFNCFSCRAGNEMCKEVFKRELLSNTTQELYAKQSFFPWELNKLFEIEEEQNLDVIDELKISNRPCTYEYLDKCLESYIFNKDEKEYITESYKNYHLWGRQSNLTPYFKNFKLEEINKIKLDLWN